MLTRVRLAGAGALSIVVAGLGVAIATVGHQGDPRVEVPFVLFSLLGGTSLALTGMLLLGLRPGHHLGPVLTVTGLALVLEFALREIAFAGGAQPWVPALVWLSLISDVVWFPLAIALVLLLFPDGRPSSPGWVWVVRGVLGLAGLRILLQALTHGPLEADSHSLRVEWPGIPGLERISGLLDLISILVLPVAVVSLIVRFRRSGADDRQRLKPLGLAALVIVVGLSVQLLPGLHQVGIAVFVAGITVVLPLALAIGALRYRVWDLDPILIGAFVYTGLAVLVTGTYVAVVVVASVVAGRSVATPGPVPSIAATVVVAVLFGPVKQNLERAAKRMVYGVRSSPYAVLNALPHQLVEVPAVSDVLPRTAETLARGLGVPAARVRAVLDSGGTLQSWSPQATNAPEDELLVVTVRHAGVVVGDVAVLPSPDRPLSRRDRTLLTDLAAQAGPAIRAVSLDAAMHERLRQIEAQAAELHESRQRIVSAQVAERRRIERDIHDGAQQQLVGLAVRLQKAGEFLEEPDAARAQLAAAAAELSACIDGLRQLARGIYPPVLTARGLAAALRAQARSAPNEILIEASAALDQHRPSAAVEVAAYFCCLEAIQNAARHASDARVTVRLDRTDNDLFVEVSDNGPGFDVAAPTGEGSGLLSIRDRVGAAGGTFELISAPGDGTTLRARFPSA